MALIEKSANAYGLNIGGRRQTVSENNYIKGGELIRGDNAHSIMVTSSGDLAELAGKFPPGSIAYTAGFAAMWQLAADGSWVSI